MVTICGCVSKTLCMNLNRQGNLSLECIFYAPIVHVVQEFMAFIRSYVVPEGFPNSVTPSYVPYMTWRALKVYNYKINALC